MKLLVKWMILVTLSAVASIFAAVVTEHSSLEDVVGMLLGITTVIFVYYYLDIKLERIGRLDWRKSLYHSVYIKMGLQIIPAIELLAGGVAVSIMEALGEGLPVVLQVYIITLLVALQFSLVVGLIFAIMRYVTHIKRKHSLAA